MTDDKKLEILYAHYRDIVDARRNNIRYRYRYLFYILIVTLLILLQTKFPTDIENLVSTLLAHILRSESITISFQIVEFGFSFALMLLIVRYLQISINVERSYQSTNRLEDQLNCLFGDKVFLHEGESYLENYPKFLDAIDILYKQIIPLIFVLVALMKIAALIPICLNPEYLLPNLNAIFAFVIIYFVGLYWWFLLESNNQEHAESQQAENIAATSIGQNNPAS